MIYGRHLMAQKAPRSHKMAQKMYATVTKSQIEKKKKFGLAL